MRYIDEGQVVELTARNITALLAKLDDHLSTRTLVSPDGDLMIRAVEDEAARRAATGDTSPFQRAVLLTRDELWCLTTPNTTVIATGFTLRSVPDEAHYRDRTPGTVYMPGSGVSW